MKANQSRDGIERLKNSLNCTIQAFRKGDDKVGIEQLEFFIEDCKHILDLYECCDEISFDSKLLLIEMQDLLIKMQNNDIVSMIDCLEYEIYPIFQSLFEGSEKQ